MRVVAMITKWFLVLVVVAVAAVAGWLYFMPPDLIRVGAGYSAKIVCSNVFVAGRNAQDVLEVDVQAPGHPLLRLMSVDVDRESGEVAAGLFGVFGTMRAIHRDGLGCASAPDGEVVPISMPSVQALPRDKDAAWPVGEAVTSTIDPAIMTVLDDSALAGPGMRAIVVVKDGRVIGERYGDGFSMHTPLLGWSMTKTVTAAILGTLDDRLPRDRQELLPSWEGEQAEISLADLMSMSSGLQFNEDYGNVTDVTRMLYLESDMADFAADKSLMAEPGAQFSYSSGTTVVLSRIWQNLFDNPSDALAWPHTTIFEPIGMTSAILETDATGTYAGSSYLYATARDWARFGQFLLQGGSWDGEQILPAGYVDWMREPSSANPRYGRGQLWLEGGDTSLPDDTFWLRGHDGQVVAVIPSQDLVIVRLGLTPSGLDYSSSPLVEAVVAASE